MKIWEKLLGSGNVLYYPGCLIKFAGKDLNENYKKILNQAGVDFIELKNEVCCGSPILGAGHKQVFKELGEKNLKLFKEHGIKKIITPCPSCYSMFKQTYSKEIKDWDIEVEHITQTIDKAIKENKLKVNNNVLKKLKTTYHDPCHLGRYSGIYEEPRQIVKKLGYDLKEMKLNKEMSFCCGAGSSVRTNYPKVAESIANQRIKMAQETGAEILFTSCPMCYMHLKENAEKSKSKIKVKELSQLILEQKNE